MGVDADIDITTEDRKTVLTLLQRHLPGTAAWVYGSRVKWTSRPQSDLDLVVFATPKQRRQVGDLREAFEESNLPFRVDLFVWEDLPDSFRRRIEAEHVLLAREPRHCNADWREALLGDVTDFVSGGTPSKAQSRYWGGSIPWVSARDMKHFRLRDTTAHITPEGLANGTRQVPIGSVLLLTRGMTLLNDVPVCVTERPMAFNQDVKALRPKPGIAPAFLPYLVLGSKDRLLNLVDLAGHGTGRLNTDELKTFDILLPPCAEQRAIAHILGTLDHKIELNRRMNATLEAMARALFKSWFVDFDPVRAKMEGRDTGLPQDIADLFPNRLVESELGEIPRGWMVRTLGDLCHKPQYGYTASAKSEPVGPQFLRITDINKKSWVSWSRVPYCEATNDELLKYRLNKGEVLIARMADPGHGILVEDDVEAVFASYLIRFKPIETHHARLLQYWLKSDAYWQLVTGQAAGTTRVSLNARVLSQFPLIVPPDSVATAFAEAVGALRDRLVRSAREMDSLAALRDTLLPKLVSGELRLRPSAPALRDVDRTRAGRVGPRRLNSE